MNTHTIKQNIMQNINPYRRVFRGLMVYTGLLMGLYLFFIGGIVFNIIAKKDVQSKVRELTSKISVMESSYLALSSDVNMNSALEKGFVQNKNVYYVKKGIATFAYASLR